MAVEQMLGEPTRGIPFSVKITIIFLQPRKQVYKVTKVIAHTGQNNLLF